MDPATDEYGRYVVLKGKAFSVVCAVQANGKSPCKDSLEQLAHKQKAVFLTLRGMLEAAADYCAFHDLGYIKREKTDLYAFILKREKYRVPFFRDGQSLVLTHGFFKDGQKWPPEEFARAERIMAEDRSRVALRRGTPK